ncbi:hypothetical protein QUF90_18770 [Desulfococcaceae bacterium HSG9]|nr:hypothetical protein [Desulfococcaceae bacterium HSG9]
MRSENISDQFNALPLEAQRQILDFMDFLKTRYSTFNKEKKSDLADEPFIGMWRNREDMQDSSQWVRNTRIKEWKVSNG